MSEVELPHESLEKAEHGSDKASYARTAAMVIAVLAAALAVVENGAKDAQTAYLANHVAASDTWAQYQAKSVRRTTLTAAADVMESLPTGADPLVRRRIEEARANAERMRSEPGADGMQQLATRVQDLEHARDHELHRYHGLELGSGGLQIAIVLASVSIVTGIRTLLFGGSLLGGLAAGYGLLAAISLV